jgi:hypothetical protein
VSQKHHWLLRHDAHDPQEMSERWACVGHTNPFDVQPQTDRSVRFVKCAPGRAFGTRTLDLRSHKQFHSDAMRHPRHLHNCMRVNALSEYWCADCHRRRRDAGDRDLSVRRKQGTSLHGGVYRGMAGIRKRPIREFFVAGRIRRRRRGLPLLWRAISKPSPCQWGLRCQTLNVTRTEKKKSIRLSHFLRPRSSLSPRELQTGGPGSR